MSRLLCLAGATATGKTALAHALAERLGARLLSADAMLVYRGMDVGTAKPTPDERARFAYRGLDCVDPDRDFSAGGAFSAMGGLQRGESSGRHEGGAPRTPDVWNGPFSEN